MSTMNNDPASVNTVVCPRCGGLGTVRYTRRGGWINETCTICRGRGTTDPDTAATVRELEQAAANPPVIVVDDDEPSGPYRFDADEFLPSEADLASYYHWRASSDARAAVAHPDFRTTIARAIDLFADSENDHLRWIGQVVLARLHVDAVRLEATSGEQLEDRMDAERDAMSMR